MMKIVFMGTPEFGAVILDKLITAHEIVLVVTQPDKTVGRKRKIESSPVKKLAQEHNLNVYQPRNIRKEYEEILKYDFDIIVTAAYGQIVGKQLLDYPRYKAINVHGSLLPKYRGGAPIQRAIINGENTTGITIMFMAEKMDAGDIIMQKSLPILDEDNSDSLFQKLAHLGAGMILPALDQIEKGKIEPIKQNEEEVTFAYNLTKEDELIDFNKNARSVFNQIRGLATNPGAYFKIDNLVIKVYDSEISDIKHEEKPGIIIDVANDSFTISCGDNSAITFKKLKPAGSNLMPVKSFLNGKGRNLIIKNRRI